MADPERLLPFLTKECQGRGVQIFERELGALAELFAEYDVVVNCSGLGAQALVPDEAVAPARGVTVRMAAPWIKHFVVASGMEAEDPQHFAHVLPRVDVAVVGGCKEAGNLTPEASPEEVERYGAGALMSS
jgi:hypothetical protein